MWETTFADHVTASSRDVAEPWIGGHVHVLDLDGPQHEPVRTDPGAVHLVGLFAGQRHRVEQSDGLGGSLVLDRTIEPGDLHVVSPQTNGRPLYTRWSAPLRIVTLTLTKSRVGKAASELGLDYGALEFRDRYSIRDPLLEALADALVAEVEDGAPSGRLYAEEMLHAAAVHLVARHTAQEPTARAHTGGLPAASLRRVAALVHADLAAELALADLAAAAGYSEWHFSRAFKASTGETPSAYVRRLRVEAGARLLRESSWGVASVAALVGYASPSRFAAAFRARWGASPSAYRREHAR